MQYSNDGGANWLPAAPGQVVAMDTTSHTFTGLAAGTYSTRVRAFSSGGFTSAWVQGTAVQVDVYEFIADVRVERGGSVRLAGSIDVWLRGRPVSTAIAIALGEITLRREPAYGSLNAEGHHTRANEIFTSNLGRLRIGADGDSYNHRSDGVDFDVSSDADPDDPMDSFDIEIAGVLYTVPITIFNRAPRIVDTPSAGPYTVGTGGRFDVADDFTDALRETLTYELGTVTGPTAAAVTRSGSMVTIGTTAEAGTYSIPVTASDGVDTTTYTYTVVVNPASGTNQAPTVAGTPSTPGPLTAGTEDTFDASGDFMDPDAGDVLSYALGAVTGPMPSAVTISDDGTVTI